ncbi:hypothetical protein NQ318_013758 [Aromia moschata]|uniref:THAP-type domain-containing protein n=1 Tax=Aromia moschata TaxID=1265417 RepID=A0AAV8Z880_9CUCU|nr:hypothetical protein NQ318_013758 [Aromia moschata]
MNDFTGPTLLVSPWQVLKPPNARIDKRKAWILKLRIRKPVSKFMRVCSLHFAEEDYYYRSKDFKKLIKILKNTAVPLNS